MMAACEGESLRKLQELNTLNRPRSPVSAGTSQALPSDIKAHPKRVQAGELGVGLAKAAYTIVGSARRIGLAKVNLIRLDKAWLVLRGRGGPAPGGGGQPRSVRHHCSPMNG